MHAEPTSIVEVLSRINGGDLAAIAVIFMGLVVVTIVVIAVTIQKIHKNRLDDALKRELVERGFSAEEIARIIESAPPQQSLLRQILRGCATAKESRHVHV